VTVTSNERIGAYTAVTCNDCKRYSNARRKRLAKSMPQDWWSSHCRWADWHCTSCHADADHYACEHCGECMAQGRDARYCSSTCRVYAWRKRKAAETDNDLFDGDTIVTYNSHAERVEAETRDYYRRAGDSLFGSPPKTEEEWSKSIQFWIKHESNDTALLCAQCHRDIGSEEPVWRSINGVSCKNCVSDAWRRVGQKPCEGCSRATVHSGYGRPFVYEPGLGRTQRTFCCKRCQEGFYRRRRKERLSDERLKDGPRRCEHCEEILDGQRSDSRYCSNACRQRAYRSRLVDKT